MGREKAGMKCVGTVLDEQNSQTLIDMFKSRDEADHLVGQQILNGIKIQESIYWIRYIAKKSSASNMVNLRTKASREFRDVCNLFEIAGQNDENFAKWLIKKGWMTEEIFGYLRPGIVELVKKRAANEFFDIFYETSLNIKKFDPNSQREILLCN